MPTTNRAWTYEQFLNSADLNDEAIRAEAIDAYNTATRPRLRGINPQPRTGSPFRSTTAALDGMNWLTDAENAIRRNVSFEDTSITRRTGYTSTEYADYLHNRKGVYQFIKDAPPRVDIGTARRTFTAARALRLPVASISRAARQYGANELSRQACQTVRHFREDYREAMNVRPTGYKVVRWFENRKIEFHLAPPSSEVSRVVQWRELTEHFKQAIRRARQERRAANVDTLATKPTNFHLQKNAIKMLRTIKKPDENVRSVGVEIECYIPRSADLTKLYPVAQYVNITQDGSIRPEGENMTGAEFRVCAPAYKMQEVITTLCAILKDLGAKVNTSCGLHVHLDQRNRTPDEVQATFANFIRAQNLLLSVVPKSRRENNFCKKHRGTDFQSAMYGQRYKIVNASAYRKHKTIEIRLFNGTVNATKIVHWIKTLWAIEAGQPVLRCPKTFDIAQRYWRIDAPTLQWLKARQDKFKDVVTADNTDVMDVDAEPIEEN